MTSALLSLANFLIALAASTASPLTNAIAVGPTNRSSRPSMPASAAARLTSVFLATVYVAESPSERRRSLRLATVSPRYSVTSVAEASLNCSAMSATAVALSALAMHASSWLVASVNPEKHERPDADRSGRKKTSASSSCVGRPGYPGTFNRFLGDRRSSVELHKNSGARADQPKRWIRLSREQTQSAPFSR